MGSFIFIDIVEKIEQLWIDRLIFYLFVLCQTVECGRLLDSLEFFNIFKQTFVPHKKVIHATSFDIFIQKIQDGHSPLSVVTMFSRFCQRLFFNRVEFRDRKSIIDTTESYNSETK